MVPGAVVSRHGLSCMDLTTWWGRQPYTSDAHGTECCGDSTVCWEAWQWLLAWSGETGRFSWVSDMLHTWRIGKGKPGEEGAGEENIRQAQTAGGQKWLHLGPALLERVVCVQWCGRWGCGGRKVPAVSTFKSKYSWYKILHLLHVHNILIWHLSTLQWDHHTKSSKHLSPGIVIPMLLTIFPFTGWVEKMKHFLKGIFPLS